MLDGRQDDLEGANLRALPPVELDGVADAGIGQPRLEPERNDEERRPARLRGERLHARRIEMVVVVVRDDDGVDVWQVGDARSEKIGSVRTLLPPTWTSVLAWPIHVTAGTIAGPAAALARTTARSGSTCGVSCCGALGSPARADSMRHWRSAPSPFWPNST